jgi:8-oxo-dGTP pyrophosphatase MutT (NUDIX family)
MLTAPSFGPCQATSQNESSCALGIGQEVVQPRAMHPAKLELVGGSPTRPVQGIKRQQVAAVCFRILSTGVEFLLVRTRRNRWTFPKGGIQQGLTHAQSAAIEAYEEAGVHGRIEETAFARYTLRKSGNDESGESQHLVHAHLCEVLRLGEPEELGRNPTWFSSAKAKRRVAEGRTTENGAELARVIDRALARIRRFPGRNLVGNDPLMKVKLEASELHMQSLIEQPSSVPPIIRTNGAASSPHPSQLYAAPRRGKILQLRLVQPDRP